MNATRGSPSKLFRPGVELADIVRRHGPAYCQHHVIHADSRRVLRAIESCRTARMGGHRATCACGHTKAVYHSCRNRHCPKCQSVATAQWLEARQTDLLPTTYFHNVFTLPHALSGLVLANRRVMINLLFAAVAETLQEFGRRHLQGRLGFTAVLHTWDQQLRPHVHLHVVIAGGALTEDGRWRAANKRFLFSVRALSRVFRGKFIDRLNRARARGDLTLTGKLESLAGEHGWNNLRKQLHRHDWVVYSKRPFGGPRQVLEYLGRYTHRVAISNHRLVSLSANGQVTFRYRDRADGDRIKHLRLPAEQFLGRFLCHVLPTGLMRIRHYGFLANRCRGECLADCRNALGVDPPADDPTPTVRDRMLQWTGDDIDRCPRCGAPLHWVELSPNPNAPLPADTS